MLDHVPKQIVMVYGPHPLYHPTVEKKLEALQYYSKIQESLVPKDTALASGHLWHNDLHHENLFVDSDNLRILGIIDWQSTQITPLTDYCLDPSFLDYDGPDVGDDLGQPKLPDEIKTLEGEGKAVALNRFMDKAVMIAWRSLVRDKNPAQYSAMKFQQSTRGHLLQVSRRIFDMGEAHFRALILDLPDEWANSACDGSAFQIAISDQQTEAIEADLRRAELGVKIMKEVEARLEDLWSEKGVVEHENYKEVKVMLQSSSFSICGLPRMGSKHI